MILVTGGAGFIGSNVAATFAERGIATAVCDRLGTLEKWRNIAKIELQDILAPEDLLAWLEAHAAPLTAIVHLGAITSTTERDADLIAEVNFRLSCRLWEWCARHGKRLLYASSAATYGDGAHGFDDDASAQALQQLRPLNAYGWSKHLFDRWVVRRQHDGLPAPAQCVGLKFFNVYGPNEYHKADMRSVVARKYPQAAAGEAITLFRSYREGVPDGGQKRDFVYVRDCCEVLSWLYEHQDVNGLFNLGSGAARSFLDLGNALYAALGRSARVRFIDMPEDVRAQYQYFTQANMSRLRAAGYRAALTPLEAGVAHYVQNYLSQADPFR